MRLTFHFRKLHVGTPVQQLIKILFSPIAFAIGFLTPLMAQTSLAAGWTDSVPWAYGIALTIAIALGVMAQTRGSWLWLKP